MAYADRQEAWRSMLTDIRRYNAALATTMAGVAENTISAGDIVLLNANIAALVAAVVAANVGLMARDEA